MNMSKRVFIGLNNIAGVGLALKEGFEKLGFKADFFSSEKTMHKYNYFDNDNYLVHRINWSRFKFIRYFQSFMFILKWIMKYKYFIFLQGSEGYLLSHFKDIKLLTRIGKKVAVVFTGCDVRLPDLVKKFKWNPCSNCPESYKHLTGCRLPDKYSKLEKLKKNFEYIFSHDECAGYFQPNYFPILFPVRDIRKKFFLNSNMSKNKKFTIAHAPSNEDYKGTRYIFNVINQLKNKFDFEFVIFQNLYRQELYQKITECDLIIDQMLVGSYGILSVESMYLEKPVVCYIRPDIWEKIKDECPIYNANPDTLYDVLENILKNPQQIEEIGRKSKEYAIKYHSPENVARYIISKIEERY